MNGDKIMAKVIGLPFVIAKRNIDLCFTNFSFSFK